MENQMARRRTNVIAAHLASTDDVFAAATQLFPMSCSNQRNSVAWRCDNRTNFARQGSSSQGCFMRQAVKEQRSSKSISCGDGGTNALEAPPPMLSRPAFPAVEKNHPVIQGSYCDRSPDVPMFARPNRKRESPQIHLNEMSPNLEPNASVKWSPKMDIEESGLNYFVTLEIPGVSVDNIKVEVNNHSLLVTGNRSTLSCGTVVRSNEPASSFHQKEILQGPYHVVWTLPSNANKENVTAEIQDGLLLITVPKLSALRWLRKAHM